MDETSRLLCRGGSVGGGCWTSSIDQKLCTTKERSLAAKLRTDTRGTALPAAPLWPGLPCAAGAVNHLHGGEIGMRHGYGQRGHRQLDGRGDV